MCQNDAVQLCHVRGPHSDGGKCSSGAEDEAVDQGSPSAPGSHAGGWGGPIQEVSVAPKGVPKGEKGSVLSYSPLGKVPGHGIINSKVPLIKTNPSPVVNDIAPGGKASHVSCLCLA